MYVLLKRSRLYVCSVAKPRTRQHNLDALVKARERKRDEEKEKKEFFFFFFPVFDDKRRETELIGS